jgi:hypothetical protein
MASNERFIQISETDTETFIQSMKNDNNPRYPVKMFKTYIRRQPSDSLKPDSKFYLSVLPRYHDNNSTFDEENSNIWYSMQPMEKNHLGEIVKDMADKTQLSARKVNHSARKTTVTSLLHSNIEATTVMQLTGHKNVESVNEYGSASFQQQMNMSNILSSVASGNNNDNIQIEQHISSNTISNTETSFPYDDQILANIDLSESIKCIENYEGKVNVKDSNIPKGRFSMFANASISNVTINIYGNDGASALIGN